jgi:hypothetical protein
MGNTPIRRLAQRVRHHRKADGSLEEFERLANSHANTSSPNTHWN